MSYVLFFLSILVALMLLPSIWRLTLALWSSIFQIYTIPVLGFYPSFAMLSTLSLAPSLIQYKRTLTQWPVLLFIALILLQTISLSWSPDLHLGIATILYELPFLIVYIIAFNVALHDPLKLLKLIKVYSILSLAPLLAVIIFKFNVDLNVEFLKSSIATFLINPHTIAEFLSDSGYSQWASNQQGLALLIPDFSNWTSKPRGFFINPNVGAGYLGICALLFWGIGTYFRSNLIILIAVLHWLTIIFTYSFAALGLGLLIPLIMFSTFTVFEKKYILGIKNTVILKSIWASCALISTFFLLNKSNILSLIIFKLKSRLIFWKVATAFMSDHLLRGQGFGGWDIAYNQYRESMPNPLLATNYPPHDSLIQLWSQSGILAVILGGLFVSPP